MVQLGGGGVHGADGVGWVVLAVLLAGPPALAPKGRLWRDLDGIWAQKNNGH
jgi:hypothetical protein